MNTIHKRNGKLHIYVRQDKYKGELKSHNWVGRTSIDGKQRIASSGTTDLEKATVILEKWFDDLHFKKEQSNSILKKEDNIPKIEDEIPKKDKEISNPNQSKNTIPTYYTLVLRGYLSMFEKLRNIKLSKLSYGKETTTSKNPGDDSKQNKLKKFVRNFFKAKFSKMSVVTEEIVGIDITREAIRVAQVSKDNETKWILDKFCFKKISYNIF